MNSFAALLPTLGYLSMNMTEYELMSRADVKCMTGTMSVYD